MKECVRTNVGIRHTFEHSSTMHHIVRLESLLIIDPSKHIAITFYGRIENYHI